MLEEKVSEIKLPNKEDELLNGYYGRTTKEFPSDNPKPYPVKAGDTNDNAYNRTD